MFREAARRLEVAPSRAVMFEDALAGVEAGRAAGFALVVGLRRAVRPEQLRQAGADAVISELAEVCLEASGGAAQCISHRELPSALKHIDAFTGAARRPVLFLDFDGTLAPIADDPDAVYLSDPMRVVLESLARRTTVAVISGRDLEDVRKRVALENTVYAGSHGFDIAGPEDTRVQFEKGGEFSGELEKTEQFLREAAAAVPGARVEHKRFSVALHYRLVPEPELPEVQRIADEALSRSAGLRRRTGKKVFEFQPDIEWDKGRAVRWLLEALRLDIAKTLPVYIGDDETDEDAFLALEQDGIGIAVQERPSATAARYRLRDPEEVKGFLEALQGQLDSPGAGS
jgi:alpha,alpha-trehalase